MDDIPGPGQSLARGGIRIACEGIYARRAQLRVSWAPGHSGIPENEIADSWAVDMARRTERLEKGRRERREAESSVVRRGSRGGGSNVISLAFLKTLARRRANAEWTEEIIRRQNGARPFRIPVEGEAPGNPREPGQVPKELASRFFQLALGHAMIAPFLRDKFGWIESDLCRWCGTGRQTREHLFKECLTWKK